MSHINIIRNKGINDVSTNSEKSLIWFSKTKEISIENMIFQDNNQDGMQGIKCINIDKIMVKNSVFKN